MKKTKLVIICLTFLLLTTVAKEIYAESCSPGLLRAMREEGLSEKQIELICKKAHLYDGIGESGVIHPEITVNSIMKDVIGKGSGDIQYHFLKPPIEVKILESKYQGNKALVTTCMHTKYKGMRTYVRKGRVRLHYEWIAGEWNLIRLENISLNLV